MLLLLLRLLAGSLSLCLVGVVVRGGRRACVGLLGCSMRALWMHRAILRDRCGQSERAAAGCGSG